jgi:hypothetical protein
MMLIFCCVWVDVQLLIVAIMCSTRRSPFCNMDTASKQTTACFDMLQVYNLLHNVRSNPEGLQEDESYTARVLRNAITPECVQRVRSSTNEQLLMQFRELVMRVSFHLGREERRLQREAAAAAAAAAVARQKAGKRKKQQQQQQQQQQQRQQQRQQQEQNEAPPPEPQRQPAAGSSNGSGSGSGSGNSSSEPKALVSSLDQVVDEYSLHIMLVSMVSFKSVQRLCLYSLDSLQKCSPPPGYWADVLAEMQLTPDQMQQVGHAWGCYAEKIAPHFKRTQELAKEVKELLAAADMASSGMGRLGIGSNSFSTSTVGDSRPVDPSPPPAAAGAAGAADAAGTAEAPVPMQADILRHQGQLPQVAEQQQQQQQQQQQHEGLPIEQQQQQQGNHQHEQEGPLEFLQPRIGSSSSGGTSTVNTSTSGSSNTGSSGGSGSTVKPWQEFGLGSTSGLGVEDADKLQELLQEMTQHFSAMSQLSHAHTFPVWNMFSRLQLARLAVASYPFMPNICQSE